MGAIVLTGIPAGYALPGNYIETNLGVGPVNGSDATYPVLFIGNATAAGDCTKDSVVYGGPNSPAPLQTEQDWINRFGDGSELYRMFIRFTDSVKGATNQTTQLYAIAVTQSAGAQATGAITYATTATGSGSTTVWVDDDFVSVPINTGDTPTVIAANVASAISQKTHWPATATPAAGVVTLTARQNGLRGNWLRFQATIVSNVSIGVTSSATAVAFFTGGTTADSNVTALSNIINRRFYYIVSAAEDATQFGAVAAQVAATALPAVGLRQRCIGASVDTQANAITIATGVNNARAEYGNLPQSDWVPSELAAHLAGVYTLLEVKPKPRHNFSGFGNGPNENAIWKVPAPRSGATQSAAVLNTAIQNGLTPIGVNLNGTTYIVKRCTTRCLNGANPDFRSRDAHKVTVTDYFADDWYAKLVAQFSGKDITADPTQGQHVPGSTVATPLSIKGALTQLIVDYNNNDQLKNALTQIIPNLVVQQEANPTTRASTMTPLQVIDILDQTTNQINQIA